MIDSDDPRLRDSDELARLMAEAACIGAAELIARREARDAWHKADGSPVCSADLAADQAAKVALAERLPGFPVISEESVDAVAAQRVFILLDPLDGTREFLAGGDSYCVAIGLIVDERPVAGAIAAPALGRLWFAGARAFEQRLDQAGQPLGTARPIKARATPGEGPVALASRFHGDDVSMAVLAAMAPHAPIAISSAVKFGLIASGEADLHVRGSQTMEWDIAAGEAILNAAGGVIRQFDGSRPRYGCTERGYRNPCFVAAANEELARRALSLVQDMSGGDQLGAVSGRSPG